MGEKCVVAEYILPIPVLAERVQLYESYIEPQIAQRILEVECFVEPQATQNLDSLSRIPFSNQTTNELPQSLIVEAIDQTHPVTSSPSELAVGIQRIPDQRINISDSQPVITRIGNVRNPTREELYTFIYSNFSEEQTMQALNIVLAIQPNQTINLSELVNTISGNLPTVNPSREICNLISERSSQPLNQEVEDRRILVQHHLNMEIEDPRILEIDESYNTDNLVVIAEQHNTRIQLNLCILIGLLSVSIFLLVFGLNTRSFIK